MRTCLCCLLLIWSAFAASLDAETRRYRLAWRDDPSTTVSIIWDHAGGEEAHVVYDTVDHGADAGAYAHRAAVEGRSDLLGMRTRVVRLAGLQPDTAYYFMVVAPDHASRRLWFRTAPDEPQPFTLVAGGDSRNNREPRRQANRLVAKLRPLAVLFGGDLTSVDSPHQWQGWLDDWQQTISDDGRCYPILCARGNHDRDRSIHHMLDTPNRHNVYALGFAGDLLRTYILNTEIAEGGEQAQWLERDLSSHPARFRIAVYHKPMRPHQSRKSEGDDEYAAWAELFHRYGVDLAVECDSHMVKRTWPIRPSTGPGSDEGFVRDDANGTVYIGEGCWGAPLRANDDDKTWTRASGRFNQFSWIHVHLDRLEIRTVRVDDAADVGEVDDADPFTPPPNLDIWTPPTGAVVTIHARR